MGSTDLGIVDLIWIYMLLVWIIKDFYFGTVGYRKYSISDRELVISSRFVPGQTLTHSSTADLEPGKVHCNTQTEPNLPLALNHVLRGTSASKKEGQSICQ